MINTNDRMLMIDSISRPAYPDRLDISSAGISELVESLRSIGLLHPISVKPLDNGYELISGDRRMTAAILLGWTEIWSTIHRGLNALDVSVMRAQENLQRQNLTPMEEAFAVQRVHRDHQIPISAVAEMFGRSTNWVTARLSLCELDDSLRQAVHAGLIKIGHALALATVDDDDTRSYMHQLCQSEGATLSVLLGWIRDYNLESNPPAEPGTTPQSLDPALDLAPKTTTCTVCSAEELLTDVLWRPICGTCIRAAS